jgi:hypothetical protein
MSLRQSSSTYARLILLSRHGRKRAVRVVRERFDDVLLLLVAVAIALVIRGIPRHQIIGGLEDAGWAALAVALYLPIVFVVGVIAAARSLSRWDVSHTSIVQGVTLNLSPVAGGIIPCEGRCVVHCSDGSGHSSVAFPDPTTGSMTAVYNATFPSTGVYPPHGDHVARWYVKETPRDGWIKVAEDTFTYAPANAAPPSLGSATDAHP